MSKPRRITKGGVWLLTRRCALRMLLMRPDAKANQILEYTFAEAAVRFGIVVICFGTMSNHYHAVVHDPQGRLPEFIERFHMLSARAMNHHLGRRENFWSSAAPGVTELVGPGDVLAKTVYALANPVVAQLVVRALDWPGVSTFSTISGDQAIGHRKVIRRPVGFFHHEGSMPERVVLEPATPPGWTPKIWTQRVRAGVAAEEKKAAVERERTGRKVLGSKALRLQSPFDKPATPEAMGKLNPAIACKDKWARIAALARLRAFRVKYREAWEKYRNGMRDVVFPIGTWMMNRRHGMALAPA